MLGKLNVPWITKDGYFDFTKYPIDSVLKQALSQDDNEFIGACSVLSSMYNSGRQEAAIYMYGLIGQYYCNISRKDIIIKFIKVVKTKECANILFKELNGIKSNNSSRNYINTMINVLMEFPLVHIKDGFEELLNNKKWSAKMKRKFEDILLEKDLFAV